MINENRRAILGQYTQIMSYEDMLDIYYEVEEYIPQEIKCEMQGLADGSCLPFEDIAISSVLDLISHDTTACVSGAAWDTASTDGKLYHFRSHDWTLQVKDPETGKYLQDNIVLIVRKPDDGYASIYPTFAGLIGYVGGFNEEGITIGSSLSWCMNDISNQGCPIGIRIKMALDKSSDIDEAISVIDSNKTRGFNCVISDSETKTGVVIELSVNHSYIGSWDDPKESNMPFYGIENVVRRGNFYVNRTMAKLQRSRYNPISLLGFILNSDVKRLLGKYDSYKYRYFPETQHYKILSRQLKKNWGDLDLDSTIEILRSIYRKDIRAYIFNLPFLLAKMIYKNRLYNVDNYQWVVCPETGEFLIAFCQGETRSQENEIHNFNMNDLWDATPP